LLKATSDQEKFDLKKLFTEERWKKGETDSQIKTVRENLKALEDTDQEAKINANKFGGNYQVGSKKKTIQVF
jgi:hypothetical protein